MFLFAPFLINGQGASTKEEANLAQLIDLEWKIFNEEEGRGKAKFLLEKSRSYREAKDYNSALATLDRINLNIVDDSLENLVTEERIYNLYFNGEYEQAENAILEANLLGLAQNDDLKLIEVLNHVALEDKESAMSAYSQLKPDKDVDNVFKSKRFKNPNKAFGMSIIIPGSGQIYSGNILKGITSLGIQGAFFTLGIRGVKRGYFFTEALPSVAIFQGFYFGGAEYARELTVERNRMIVKKLWKQVLDSMN